MRTLEAVFAALLTLFGCQAAYAAPQVAMVQPPFANHEEVQLLKKFLDVDCHDIIENFYPDLKRMFHFNEEDFQNMARLSADKREWYMKLKQKPLEQYLELAHLGATKKTVEMIPKDELEHIIRGFKIGRWTGDFINKFTDNREELMNYSKQLAKDNQDFGRGVSWVKQHLVEKLSARAHAILPGSDYKETPEQLFAVNNPYLLFSIKSLVAYFDSDDANAAVEKLLNAAPREEGGLFFNKQNKPLFILMPNDGHYTNMDEELYYIVPQIRKYVPHLGLMHSHPSKELKKLYPGPSGDAKVIANRDDFYKFDLGALRFFHTINPYLIDVVATRLPDRKYNIDFYFQDVVEETSKVVGDMIVLDIGIFNRK